MFEKSPSFNSEPSADTNEFVDPVEASPAEENPAESAPVAPEAYTPEDPVAPEAYTPESIEDILGQNGRRGAMILTAINKESSDNIVREGVSLKMQEVVKKHPLITRFPIVGQVVKDTLAARGVGKAKKAAREGNYEEAFQALGVDPAKSRLLSNNESVENRGWQALENAGYDENNQIEGVTSRLDQDDFVKKLSPEVQTGFRNTMNDYFKDLRANGESEELDQKFMENAKGILSEAGEDTSLVYSLQPKMDGLKKLAQDQYYTEEAVTDHINKNITLYKANLKEDTYTKQKVEGDVVAIVSGGVFGAITYAALGKSIQSETRSAIGSVVGAGGVGAVAGGVFGAASGVSRARAKLSESEIANATGSAANPDIAPATESFNAAETVKMPAVGEPTTEMPPVGEPESQSVAETGESETVQAKENFVLRAVKNLDKLRKRATGEEMYLQQIEDKRDRKNAADLINDLDQFMGQDGLAPVDLENLKDKYVDIIARSRFSKEKKIDLIRYDKNRGELDRKLQAAEQLLFSEELSHDPAAVDKLLDDENSDLNKAIHEKTQVLLENYNAANALSLKFQARSALVDGVVGAATGFAAGAIFQLAAGSLQNFLNESPAPEAATAGSSSADVPSVNELMDQVNDRPIDASELITQANASGESLVLEADPDGGYSVMVGGEYLAGAGEAPGVQFNDDGSLTPESKELFESLGLKLNETVGERPIMGATRMESIPEFFNLENQEANGLTAIEGRTWNDQAIIYDPVTDGDGNIILQVMPRDENLNVDNMTVMLTAGGNNQAALAFDVNPDGTVVIPAGSPGASLFVGDRLEYGRVEVGQMNGSTFNVYATDGSGMPPDANVQIPVPNPDAVVTTYDYSLETSDGATIQLTTPGEVDAVAHFEAAKGIVPPLGTGELNGVNPSGETASFTTNTGETVEIDRVDHFGGYQSATDAFNSPNKRGSGYSGDSIVDRFVDRLGQNSRDLSIEQSDATFMNAINTGEISESDVVEEYLQTVSNSPESIVTLRTLMGGLTADLNGDGTGELIDTQDEINMLADMISRDPASYDAFVNDTLDIFYDKVSGGSIEFTDLAVNQYQYTTWSQLVDENIHQFLGHSSHNSTNGIGLVFRDSSGNSIYDANVLRNIFHIPEGYSIESVGPRLDCGGQTVVHTSLVSAPAAGVIYSDNQGTGDEGTGDEGTGDENVTPDNPAPDNPTPPEPTPAPVTPEPTPDNPTPNQPTPDQPTPPPTPSEPEGTGNEGTGDEGTGDETTPWGKSGDPHGGDLVDPSAPVDPNAEVSKEQNDSTNAGNQGYVDDNHATPGSASDSGGVDGAGFADSGITAPGASNDGDRLSGGVNQGGSEMAGENAYQDSSAMASGQAQDTAGNNAQAKAQSSGSGDGGGLAPGQDNLSDAAEEGAVRGGNY